MRPSLTPGDWKSLGLAPGAVKHLKNSGFNHPSPTQIQALPGCLATKDLAVVAPTGSGKTLLYLISFWLQKPARVARPMLVLVPTRELAYQVSKMAQAFIPGIRQEMQLLTGGKPPGKNAPARAVSFWIATPGRLAAELARTPQMFKGLGTLVIDEYDKLMDLGFAEELQGIERNLPPRSRFLGFSATPPEQGAYASRFKGALVVNKVVNQGPAGAAPVIGEVLYYLKSPKTKNKLCLETLATLKGQAIIFTSNSAKANHLAGLLKMHGMLSFSLHGKLPQKERDKIYQRFMDKKIRVLVATDLASRGLDTLEVDTVVNFDLPANATIYIHRLGRSARRGQQSTVHSYAGPGDYIALKKIEKGLGRQIAPHPRYSSREPWLKSAWARHRQKVQREQRLEEIRRKQGLS